MKQTQNHEHAGVSPNIILKVGYSQPVFSLGGSTCFHCVFNHFMLRKLKGCKVGPLFLYHWAGMQQPRKGVHDPMHVDILLLSNTEIFVSL